MKVKVSEATKLQLNWMVAKCEGWDGVICSNPIWAVPLYIATNDMGLYTYSPTTDWSQGGPLIEREGISLVRQMSDRWVSEYSNGCDRPDHGRSWGPTPLIAAMRCFVASNLGDEVEVPEELA